MHKIPLKENVTLRQVKLKSDDTLEFKATVSFTDGDDIYKNNVNDKLVYPPHKDLKNAIKKLKEPLAKMCGLIDARTMIEAPEFLASENQLKKLEYYLSEKLSYVTVTGIALSGDGKNRGVIITGTYKGQAINSRKTKFSSELSLDNDLEPIVEEIESEVYKYVYENKKAPADEINLDGDLFQEKEELEEAEA